MKQKNYLINFKYEEIQSKAHHDHIFQLNIIYKIKTGSSMQNLLLIIWDMQLNMSRLYILHHTDKQKRK